MHVKSCNTSKDSAVLQNSVWLLWQPFYQRNMSVTEESGCLQFIADSRDTFGNIQKAHTSVQNILTIFNCPTISVVFNRS